MAKIYQGQQTPADGSAFSFWRFHIVPGGHRGRVLILFRTGVRYGSTTTLYTEFFCFVFSILPLQGHLLKTESLGGKSFQKTIDEV